jgi:hypothetical protein
VGFTFDPHLVVYTTGGLTFKPPPDPSNYAIGVTYNDSVNSGKSHCYRVGSTYSVHCDARSFSFK